MVKLRVRARFGPVPPDHRQQAVLHDAEVDEAYAHAVVVPGQDTTRTQHSQDLQVQGAIYLGMQAWLL